MPSNALKFLRASRNRDRTCSMSLMQQLPLATCPSDHVIQRGPPFVEIRATVEQQILGNRKVAEGAVQAVDFLKAAAAWLERLTFDDQQIHVRIGSRIALRPGAEQNDPLGIGLPHDDFDHATKQRGVILCVHLSLCGHALVIVGMRVGQQGKGPSFRQPSGQYKAVWNASDENRPARESRTLAIAASAVAQ